MGEIAEDHDISITRACRLMGIHKSYFYYESTKDDSEVEAAIRQKAEGILADAAGRRLPDERRHHELEAECGYKPH